MFASRRAASSVRCLFLVCCWALSLVAPAPGQGVLVVEDPSRSVRLPRPMPTPPPAEQSYKIKSLSIDGRIRDQVAEIQLSQSFVNTGSETLEASFVFPLPYDGAIDRVTLLVDGREMPGRILPADEARALYEAIVSKNRDPALLEWIGTGLFKTSVFPVPPGAERKVTIRYTQLCRRHEGLTDFLFPLATAKYSAQPIETLSVSLAVETQAPLKNLYSPSHKVDIQRADDRHATVKFSAQANVPRDDFRLMFDVDPGQVGVSLLSHRPDEKEPGYFLLLASPQLPQPETKVAKTVMFVVDRSGSMSGEKIEQAKEALKFVLGQLREGDLFNIVAYDSQVESFRPELQKVDDQTRTAARAFADGLFAGGATNIDQALATAMGQLVDTSRPTYVLFLTDGLPTEGEQNESQIAAHLKTNNHVRARMFAFGVGYDVNSRLLDRMARENYGQSEYVRPHENMEAHVSSLYRRVDAPVMTDVKISLSVDGTAGAGPVDRVNPSGTIDLFAGGQLVVVGRYRQPGGVKIQLAGQLAGETKTFEFPGTLVEKSADDSDSFVAKLWATRRVGEIIDELDLKGRNEELVAELVELSKRHGIITPYTAFLADENTNLADARGNLGVALEQTAQLDVVGGRGGFAQRASKAQLQAAANAPAPGLATFVDNEDRLVEVMGCQNVGSKTFFLRDNQWFDSTLTEEQRRQAIRIVQFSPEYFALAAKHGRTLSQCLAMDEPLVVNLHGQAYLIAPNP